MSIWFPIIGLVAVCWLLGSVKKIVKQKWRRKPKVAKYTRSDSLKPKEGLSMFYEPSPVERATLNREAELRKQATAYKRQKKYDKAVEMMRAARKLQYETSLWYDIKTLLRIPDYLILAGRLANF